MSVFWSQFVLLTLLSSFLIFKQFQRDWLRTRERGGKPDWTGAAFDASSLQSRIQHLRENYSSAIRAHPAASSHREKVVDSIRQTIKRLAFFHPPGINPSAVDPHESSRGQT